MDKDRSNVRHFRIYGGSARIVFPNGVVGHFKDGEYSTSIPEQIAYIESEMAVSPGSFMEIKESELRSKTIPVGVNAIEDIKAKGVEEYLAQLAAAQKQVGETQKTVSNTETQKSLVTGKA